MASDLNEQIQFHNWNPLYYIRLGIELPEWMTWLYTEQFHIVKRLQIYSNIKVNKCIWRTEPATGEQQFLNSIWRDLSYYKEMQLGEQTNKNLSSNW